MFEDNIEPGGDPAQQGVGEAPQRRGLAVSQKLVEYQHLTAGSQNPGDFGETTGRFGHDSEDQMQYRHVETGIGERQALRIALHRRERDMPGARQGATEHRAIEVETDISVLRWQVGQIQPGTDAGQQYVAGFGGQGSQAAPPRRQRGAGNRRIVERRNQRVAVLQAQCSTRGMASVNSGISASKCVPSSATI